MSRTLRVRIQIEQAEDGTKILDSAHIVQTNDQTFGDLLIAIYGALRAVESAQECKACNGTGVAGPGVGRYCTECDGGIVRAARPRAYVTQAPVMCSYCGLPAGSASCQKLHP